MGEGIEDLTGAIATERFLTDIFDKDFFWNGRLLKVNTDFLVTCASVIGAIYPRKGFITCHTYSIHRAVEIEGDKPMLLKNPCGDYEWQGPWCKF
jgi:hypothetical protein